MATKVRYETIITVDPESDTFALSTTSRKLKNRMARYEIDADEEAGTRQIFEEVPLSWLRIQRPRQYSEEELDEVRERLASARSEAGGKKSKAKAKAKAAPSKNGSAAKSKVKPKAKAEVDDEDEEELEEDEEEEDEPVEVVRKKGRR